MSISVTWANSTQATWGPATKIGISWDQDYRACGIGPQWVRPRRPESACDGLAVRGRKVKPQWGPATKAGIRVSELRRRDVDVPPQWGPVTKAGISGPTSADSIPCSSMPQWGPATKAGISVCRRDAAHAGRGGLNGVRPRRPESGHQISSPDQHTPGLNGVRPRRPESGVFSVSTTEGPLPQWGPATKAGISGWRRRSWSGRTCTAPQWGPATKAGIRRRGFSPWCQRSGPQWGPATKAGISAYTTSPTDS